MLEGHVSHLPASNVWGSLSPLYQEPSKGNWSPSWPLSPGATGIAVDVSSLRLWRTGHGVPKLRLQDDYSLGVLSHALPLFPKTQDKAMCFSQLDLAVPKT